MYEIRPRPVPSWERTWTEKISDTSIMKITIIDYCLPSFTWRTRRLSLGFLSPAVSSLTIFVPRISFFVTAIAALGGWRTHTGCTWTWTWVGWAGIRYLFLFLIIFFASCSTVIVLLSSSRSFFAFLWAFPVFSRPFMFRKLFLGMFFSSVLTLTCKMP